jgi:hypothetical protein
MSDTRFKSINGKWVDAACDDKGRLLVNSLSNLKMVTASKTIPAAGNYTANDVVSENATIGTAWRFVDVSKRDGRGFRIINAHMTWSKSGGITAIIPRTTLFLFKQLPTSELRDNEANTAPIYADILSASYIKAIDFPALRSLGGSPSTLATPSTSGNLPLDIILPAGMTDIYGILVITDAETNETASTLVTIELLIEQY